MTLGAPIFLELQLVLQYRNMVGLRNGLDEYRTWHGPMDNSTGLARSISDAVSGAEPRESRRPGGHVLFGKWQITTTLNQLNSDWTQMRPALARLPLRDAAGEVNLEIVQSLQYDADVMVALAGEVDKPRYWSPRGENVEIAPSFGRVSEVERYSTAPMPLSA
ncbi:hypothetical protein CCM_07286 [Cordyceps militaris CM01]|uniref:Uncharacterized protein n=1 Tax=Cordyceps militaris (strain CM01) TaxID=983644 RepID=G3JMI7_CORMM|nr:uncharacterized protein CCM_07286 [Cordyceps militaris CM01]EGX90866.1 hypothetical protein CCM_07286 [Cordyceps militaris CM01]